jgi:ubiquinone/menaquinone biosynthesis C-methylase UbiE
MQAPEPPVCDYEGSDYQASFWEQGGREYEDRAEAVALRRLLPASGDLLLELGAGAGRNTPRYGGFRRIVLLDFSLSQLEQAQSRLGASEKYVYVAADVYHLPFLDGLFDAATMIRVLHHMSDAPRALSGVRDVLKPGAVFILEFANKRNLKSILRYWLGRQSWNPFSREAVEFARLNFDFHPRQVEQWLEELGLRVDRKLAVSNLRVGILKRFIPLQVLVLVESALQPTGRFWQLTPSVFFRTHGGSSTSQDLEPGANPIRMFKCPQCQRAELTDAGEQLICGNCGARWAKTHGIYDFRRPISEPAKPL